MNAFNRSTTFLLILAVVILLASCQNKPASNQSISKAEMLQIVKVAEAQFGLGVNKKDSALLVNIYTDSAQYVQPNRAIMTGKREIGKDWAGFIRLKENPIDIVFIINDVRGTREIIYETGRGYTLLADSTKWNFNYVNVWRLQHDGSYKLDMDTYTPLDNM